MAWTLPAFGSCTDLHTLVISTQPEAAVGRLAAPSVQGAGGVASAADGSHQGNPASGAR
jgi:hypothetical protein